MVKLLKEYGADGAEPSIFGTASEKAKNVGNSKRVVKELERKCYNVDCQKATSKLFECAKCHRVLYCSKECQQADWKNHKKVCSSKQEQEATHVEK